MVHTIIATAQPTACGGGALGSVPVLGPILTAFVNLLLTLPLVGVALQPFATALGC